MEKPLLGGESSGGIKSTFSRWRDESTHFLRRSDAISQGSLYQKAAALVDLAEDGVGLPEQILDQSSYETAAKIYFIYIRLDFLWALNYFALIVLNFLEKPMWCHKYSEDSCSNREHYFLGELPYLTGVESLLYEGVTVIILVLHTFFPISYEGFRIYWKSPLNKLKEEESLIGNGKEEAILLFHQEELLFHQEELLFHQEEEVQTRDLQLKNYLPFSSTPSPYIATTDLATSVLTNCQLSLGH